MLLESIFPVVSDAILIGFRSSGPQHERHPWQASPQAAVELRALLPSMEADWRSSVATHYSIHTWSFAPPRAAEVAHSDRAKLSSFWVPAACRKPQVNVAIALTIANLCGQKKQPVASITVTQCMLQK